MSPLDLLIIIALIWFVYKGAKIGLAKELVGLTGWLIAALVAIKFGGRAAALATRFLPSLSAFPPSLTGFLIALVGMHIFFRILGFMMKKMFGGDGQSVLDRFGGGLIGFIKGAFVISIIALAVASLNLGTRLDNYKQQSSLFPHMKQFAQMVVDQVVRATPASAKPAPQTPAGESYYE